MLKDITLGQYFPGNSMIHRLDPRTKLIMLVVYIVALFMASGWVAYAGLFACLVWVIKISTIPVKSIVRGMKPLVMILVFITLINQRICCEFLRLLSCIYWEMQKSTVIEELSSLYNIFENLSTVRTLNVCKKKNPPPIN